MKKLLLSLFLFSIRLLAQADGYWFVLHGSGKVGEPVKIMIYYGGVDDAGSRYLKSKEQLDKITGFKVSVIDDRGARSDISMSKIADGLEGFFVPKTAGVYQVLGINEALPVVDRSASSGIRPVQYLCAIYFAGSTIANPESIPTPKQYLDIVATKKDKWIGVQAFIRQHPVAKNTKLRIFNPENWEKLPLTDESGRAAFIPTMKGLYIIRLDWVDSTPGSYKGRPYENVRHRCDYSLFINEAP